MSAAASGLGLRIARCVRRLGWALLWVAGCAGPVDSVTGEHDASVRGDASHLVDSGPGDSGLDDPDPVFTDEERALLTTLRYRTGAPPSDPSNRFADDDAARAWGQRLFFDTRLSGPLVDGDNDGSSGSLGHVGEGGRVSCASCHVPEGTFVDTRSPHRQISLAAQWGQRRAPTLLGVAYAPLYNWDGRRDALWNQAVGVMENAREFN